MKKTLVNGVATAAVLASLGTGLGGCGSPQQDRPEALYGPPPSESSEVDTPIEDVYGPPVDLDESSLAPDEETESADTTSSGQSNE